MGVTFEELIGQMLMNAPDPKEKLPVANRPETIWCTTMPFLILTWLAVGLRCWVRFRVMREPGWDDALVLLAALLNTAATIFVLLCIKYGLGRHFLYIGIPEMQSFIKMFYFANAIYITNTAVIKISLLTQYLRIFKAGMMHWICKCLIVIIGAWGFTYGFMAWFPCFPPQAFYEKNAYPNAKCYGFGFVNDQDFIGLFESHTALNMAFDVTVFVTPMILFTKPNLKMKNLFAMAGIFILGAVVVFTSVWRLYSIVDNRAATSPYIDFTWWTPISIILSCLEIDLAIMCASMPIFWPVIEESFAAIFVTREVQITEQRRYSFADRGLAYELEHSDTMRRQASVKTQSTSRESLVITRLESGKNVEEHYKDPYLAAQVDPFRNIAQEVAVKTDVEAKKKDKWVL
ncbi:uncharacterized protein N0V89_002333 [Didymosphaeria variabile]|uniref:Rhodopsin domain-containing protein n=1 Tax=Didymosphaeria variabile TaxID=1932322 RepID=A0A9W9CE99_9PLEO|nr:uncharacterized protein N0V89_002333 [Didymosphaeria variabile]KAJ4357757.1 hypothetical protein N0V89_002333 [Didymosphaeria variabile]